MADQQLDQNEIEKFQQQNDQSSKELNEFVQDLLKQMQSRFDEMSNTITTKVDEMGKKIDEIEKSLVDLMEDIKIDDNEEAESQIQQNQ